MHTQMMISAHPKVRGATDFDCAQTCVACADACLGEAMVAELAPCIRLDLDCADICTVTGTVASRRTGSNQAVLRQLLETCAEACRLCAQECDDHASRHEHCRVCADSAVALGAMH